jgi:hypothetical protein
MVLLGILSCSRDRKWEQQARETWLKDCPVDYRFFLGEGQNGVAAPDETILSVPDDYNHLVQKVRKMIEYALSGGYDYLFKCDLDTYCHIPRLLSSGFQNQEWSGSVYGGAGYWLSRKAMFSVIQSPDETGSEDLYVQQSLEANGFKIHSDERYHSKTSEGPANTNHLITTHWYSDNGKRCIRANERFNLVPKYYEQVREIACISQN